MVRSWWLYVGVGTPLYFLIYFGLKGIGIINYGYDYNLGYSPNRGSFVQMVLSYTPLPQIAPFYLIVGIIGIMGLYIHYARTKGYLK